MLYLANEWIKAAGDALAAMTPTKTSLVVGYSISQQGPRHDPSPTSSYSIMFGPDVVSVSRGVDGADVVFSCSPTLATKIARGQQGAQRAFLDGDLRITGDVNLLLGHSAQLSTIDDLLAELRLATVFPDS